MASPAAAPPVAAQQPNPFANGYSGGSSQPPAAQPYQPPAAQPYQPPAAQPYQPPAAQQYQPPAAQPYQPPAAQPYQPPAAAQPAPSTPLEQQPWYFGTISREECEAKLAAGADGDFMVRKSSRGQNSYSLSIRASGGAPKHFKVEKTGSMWKLAQKNSDGLTFIGIPELVMHYQVNTASGVQMVKPCAGGPGGGSFLPSGGAPAAAGVRQCWDGGCTGMPMAADDRFCGGCGKQVHEITKWGP